MWRRHPRTIIALVAVFVLLLVWYQQGQAQVLSTSQEGLIQQPIDSAWDAPRPSTAQNALPGMAGAVERLKPAVVSINAEYVKHSFLGMSSLGYRAGSGWIVDQRGIIVTNDHVIENSSKVMVGLSDGRTYLAKDIRKDPLTDLAVLKINAGELPAAQLAEVSSLRVGDWVIAVGNPLGLGISAKEGIVSRFGVSITLNKSQTLSDLIETSAAINPGNSGGPLANMSGQVVGITSAKVAQVAVEGIGYAINIRAALPIIEQLVRSGVVSRPWLGISTVTLDAAAMQRLKTSVPRGVLVTGVTANSPASRAGIRTDDIITRFREKVVTNSQDMLAAQASGQVGETVVLEVWRNSRMMTVQAVLAQSPPVRY